MGTRGRLSARLTEEKLIVQQRFSQHPLELIDDSDRRGSERSVRPPSLYYIHVIPSRSLGYNFPRNEEENGCYLEG